MFLPWPKLANIFSLQEKMTSNYFVGIFVSILLFNSPKYVSFLSKKYDYLFQVQNITSVDGPFFHLMFYDYGKE
jgi:hypothetical protein